MISRLMRWLAPLLAVLMLGLTGPLAAQDLPPRPDGPIYDGAEVIDPATEAQLDQRLRAYNRDTGRAVIIATVPDLAGLTIEMYAVELFETWGISGEQTDEGVLLLIAPEARQLRIETGYGTTATLTDALSGRIIRNTIVPRFSQGDFSGGIAAGVDAIINVLDADPATREAIAEAEAAAAAAARRGGSESDAGTFIGAIFWVVMIVGFMLIFGRGGRGKGRRRYGAANAAGDILLWTALSSLSSGRGSDWGGGGGGFGGGGFGGFGGGMSGGGGASGSW